MKISGKAVRSASVFLATAVLLFVLFKTLVNAQEFSFTIKTVNSRLVVYALLLGLTGPVLSTIRWQLVLALNGSRISFKRIFSVIMATWPLSILPGRAGDFIRSYPIRKEIKPTISIGATIFEKILDISTLLLISAVGFFFNKLPLYGTGLLILSVSLIPIVFLTRNLLHYLPDIITKRLQPLFVIFNFRDLKSPVFRWASLAAIINWLASVAEVWLLFNAFGAPVSFADSMTYLPLAIFVGLLPITVAGIGTRDGAIIALFLGKATPVQSLATGIGYSFIGYFLFALIGIPFFIKEFGLFSGDRNIGDTVP